MGVQIGVFLTYAGAIILIFLVGKVFFWPIKLILKLLLSSAVGGALILLLNVPAEAIGTAEAAGALIPLNPLNALIVGVLGLPGAVLLLILAL